MSYSAWPSTERGCFSSGVHGILPSVAVNLPVRTARTSLLEGPTSRFMHGGQRDGNHFSVSSLPVVSQGSLACQTSEVVCDPHCLWKWTDCVSRKSMPFPAVKGPVAEQRDLVARSATRTVISTACSPHLPRTTSPRRWQSHRVITCSSVPEFMILLRLS